MRFVKRILCLCLMVPCVLFTGCNSILYNGNLKVKPYEPETLPANIPQKVEEKAEEAQQLEMDEKYQVAGTDAFYFLPQHENRPDEIVDFKVLDYREQEGFIYCYKTPYYGPTDEGDLGLTASKTGTAPEERTVTQTQDTEYLVTVLMSYNPDTRAYNVFFTQLETRETQGEVSAEVEGIGELTGSLDENRVMAHKLAKEDRYFLFIGNHAYLFDPQGEETWSYDYSTIISQEIESLESRYKRSGYTSQVTISDVVMDGSHYVYIPVSLQLEKEGTDGTLDLDSLDENDEELENTSFHVVLSCYNLEIGENNQEGISFTSENENWEAQKEEWLKDDGQIIGDWETLEQYLEENSMDAIKSKSPDDGGDRFPVFATVGHSINMELAGVADLFEMSETGLSQWIRNNRDLIREKLPDRLPTGYYWWTYAFWGIYFLENNFWKTMDQNERETWVSLTKALMVLKSQMDGTSIPGLAPGNWNGTENKSPLQDNWQQVEGLFASKTSVYEDGSRATRLADIQIPGRYGDQKENLPMPQMRATKYTESLTRTLYYEEEETQEDENGEEVTITTIYSYTETLDSMPLQYEMVFPEGTNVFWVESRETEAQVSPSGDFGVLYLSDLSAPDTQEEDFISEVIYDDGLSQVPLTDSQVKGKAVDSGIYYYGDEEIAAAITNTGITFYKRNGRTFDVSGKKYISLADLASSKGLTISVIGQDKSVDQLQEPELEGVGEEQEAIINEKLESGADTELYQASDLTLLNEDEMLISSMYSGVILYNLNNGMSIHLEEGSYFGSFPVKDNSDGTFMVLGYQTEEYSYQPADLAWAKCYKMDLGSESRQLETDALKEYVDRMADEYLSRIHRVRAKSGTYEAVEPTKEEQQANEQAEKLFLEAEDIAKSELRRIMDQQGFGIDFNEFWEHTAQIRSKLQNQVAGLAELYELAGLGIQEIPPENGQILEIEGRMIKASYTSSLENILVELALTDQAVANLDPEDQERYKGYQESQKMLQITDNEKKVTDSLNQSGSSSAENEDSKEEAQKAQNAIEQSAYYQSVLADLKARFEEKGYGGRNEDWEEYLQRMLEQVSPDYSTNTAEEGLEEFCRAAGISQELTDMDQLKQQLSGIHQVWELESVIISLKVSSALYQNTGYQKEYDTYQNTHYSSDGERLKAFRSAGFYQIIADLQVQNREYLEEKRMTWEELLEDIIEKCGSGIVLRSGTGETEP